MPDDARAELRRHGVAIVGLGLIGGSLARALLAEGIVVRGLDGSAAERRQAAEAGVHVADGMPALLAGGAPAITVVAVPLGAVRDVVPPLLARLAPDATVLHVAGLQRPGSTGLDDGAQRRVIGTHPLAGSHAAGFAAARADLFVGATVLAEARAGDAARARLEALWTTVGAAAVAYRTAEEHDAEMAWVSHLPQLAATALAAALAEASIPSTAGGPGLRDVTRLAASPLATWRDVLRAAPPETGAALDAAIHALDRLRTALRRGDDRLLDELWSRAQAWRGMRDAEGHRGTA